VDQFYFEEGYLEASYFTVIREADSVLIFAAAVQSAVDIAATTGYYIPDYIATDYFESGIIIQGAADFSSTAAVSITVTRVRSASGAFTAVFQQVAALSDISGSDLFAFAEAAISIQINVIRSANTAVTSVFNIATDGRRFRDTTAAEDSVFDFTAINQRSRDFNLETQAAFSLATDVDRIRLSAIDLTAVCSVTATARQIRDAHLTGTGVAALTCSASITAVVSAQMQNTVTIAANGGKRILYAAALTAFSSVSISRYVGSDRPKTLTGTFNGNLVNSANRVSDLRALATANNWYYQTLVMATASPQFDNLDAEILNIPLGNKGNFAFTLRWRSAQNITIGGNGLGASFALASPGGAFALAISFTNGDRVALYVNGVRVALNTNFNSSGWVIPKTQTVAFASGFPYTVNSRTWTSTTDYAWLTLGNYTNNGATTYTAPTVANTDDTLFLYQFNNGNEDLSATLQGSASIQSQSVVSAVANKLIQANSNVSSQFAISAVIGSIEQIDLSAFSDAAVTATVTRIKSLSSACESTSAFTADVVVTRSANVTVSANLSLSAESSRIRPFTADFTAISTQLTAVIRLAGLLADDLVSAILTADAVVTRSAVSLLTSSATVVADNFRVKFNSATTSSEFTTNIQGFVGKIGNSDISADFAQIANANRFRDTTAAVTTVSDLSAIGNNLGKIEGSLFDAVTMTTVAVKIASATANATTTATVAANTDISLTKTYQSAITAAFTDSFTAEKRVGTSVFLTAFASNLTVAVKQTVTDLDVNVVSTMSVSGVKTTSTSANLTTTATQTSTAIKNVSAVSNQSSNFAQTAVAFRAVFAFADLSVLAFELAAAVKTAGISINTVTTATMSVSAVKTARVSSNLNSNVTVVAPIQRIRTTASAINSNFTQTSNAGRSVSAQITIASAMTFVSEVREIRLDNIVYVIPGETRVYVIKGETRIHRIREETRYYTI
jgi:hypothetical protein